MKGKPEKTDPTALDLARGKKRRNNRLEETALRLQGVLGAVVNASKCQESMLSDCRASGITVPDEVYLVAIGHCDALEPFLDDAGSAAEQYLRQVDEVRRRLERVDPSVEAG